METDISFEQIVIGLSVLMTAFFVVAILAGKALARFREQKYLNVK